MKYYLILIEKLKYTVIFNLIFEKSFTFIYLNVIWKINIYKITLKN